MADGTIQLPTDGTGKKLDTESLTVGAATVHRERNQLAGTADDDIAAVSDTDVAASDHGLAVRPINVVSPTRDVLSSASLAVGASVNLDGTTIGAAKTGKLMAVTVSSSAACKWQIQSRDGAVVLTFDVIFTSGVGLKPTYRWVSPDKRFTVLLGNGVDENFRARVTNLSYAAADVYATLYWDEI